MTTDSGISLGAALCRPRPPMVASDLIAAADAQLYEAKRRGRNQACLTEILI